MRAELNLSRCSSLKPKGFMQRANGELHVLVFDQYRGFDLAGADHLDIDVFLSKSFEHQACYASMRAHADANNRHFGDFIVR